MKRLIIFTLDTCPFCDILKNKLLENSIDFHNVEITKNIELWEQVLSQTGDDALPTVFIQTDEKGDGLVYTPGRDFQDPDEIIQIIKNNI
jgi:glutaredoxin